MTLVAIVYGVDVRERLVQAAIAEATETGRAVAELSLAQVAQRAGLSRSTAYRTFQNRQALNEAVRASGHDPGRQLAVRDQALIATVELIAADGVAALTVEAVARQVGCAATSIYAAFSDRNGLLAAVFERYAPLSKIEELYRANPALFAELDIGVRTIYTAAFDLAIERVALFQALFAEVLSKPNGTVMLYVQKHIFPRVAATIGSWITEKIGATEADAVPISVLLSLLMGPLATHILARPALTAAGVPVPNRDIVIETMTSAFCRAVKVRSESS